LLFDPANDSCSLLDLRKTVVRSKLTFSGFHFQTCFKTNLVEDIVLDVCCFRIYIDFTAKKIYSSLFHVKTVVRSKLTFLAFTFRCGLRLI
jgi:hypothetical protein